MAVDLLSGSRSLPALQRCFNHNHDIKRNDNNNHIDNNNINNNYLNHNNDLKSVFYSFFMLYLIFISF